MRAILALLCVLAVATADLAPLLHADAPRVIPGSYIVIMKDGLEISHRDAHVNALKEAFALAGEGNEIGFMYNIGSLIGFSAKMTESMLKAQLAHPLVKYIEADQVYSLDYTQEERSPLAVVTQSGATWGLDRIDQASLPLNGLYTYSSQAGAGVDVYVIDTGILTTHNDFGGRAAFAFTAITGESNSDLNGHGTHCAGTIGGTTYGVAKQANLKAVKVLSGSGSGSTTGVIAGVNFVSNNKVSSRGNVASMSLGGGASTTLDQAVQNSIAGGVVYAIAAGNDNSNACNYSPARVSTAVTVGATTNTDARSSFSNYGTCVDIFAPGSSITSDWIGSNTATNTISGTSMATPHVAGVLALYLSTNGVNLTPASVKSAIVAQATSGKVTNPGTGSPNQLLFSNPK